VTRQNEQKNWFATSSTTHVPLNNKDMEPVASQQFSSPFYWKKKTLTPRKKQKRKRKQLILFSEIRFFSCRANILIHSFVNPKRSRFFSSGNCCSTRSICTMRILIISRWWWRWR